MSVQETGNDRAEQIKAFLEKHLFADAEQIPLAGDASFRRYIRVRKPGAAAMLMDAPPNKENSHPYYTVADYLYKRGYSVPAVLGHDLGAGLLLLEDLGDDLFSAVLKKDAAMEHELYSAAIDLLVYWHTGKPPLADEEAIPLPSYDLELLMREVRLFSDWYLPQVLGKEAAQEVGADYIALWERIFESFPQSTDTFVHRDYHADNLLWLPAREGMQKVGLLDFQDAVYGDAAYDVVSLLEDARRDVPPSLAEAMIERYLAATGAERERFLAAYAILGAQRNSKIIGIFVRLAARDGKFNYLNFLPRVWRYLEQDIKHPALAELRAFLDTHIVSEWRGTVDIRHDFRDLARIA